MPDNLKKRIDSEKKIGLADHLYDWIFETVAPETFKAKEMAKKKELVTQTGSSMKGKPDKVKWQSVNYLRDSLLVPLLEKYELVEKNKKKKKTPVNRGGF